MKTLYLLAYLLMFAFLLSACQEESGPRIFQIQADLGLSIPWGYEVDTFEEVWTDSSFVQNTVLKFNEGDTDFMMRKIAETNFYNIFPLDLISQLSIPDQKKFHTDMATKGEIGYWLPSKEGYYFFCPPFHPSVTQAPLNDLPNYNKQKLAFVVQAQLNIPEQKLYYTYRSFTTPEKELKKWNESVNEVKDKAENIAKKAEKLLD